MGPAWLFGLKSKLFLTQNSTILGSALRQLPVQIETRTSIWDVTERLEIPMSTLENAVQAAGDKKMTNWIVHADDFGETKEITLGIIQSIESGAVTSTSVMTNMPATAFALDAAAGLQESASFGAHLNFCEGSALAGASSLTDDSGVFLPKRKLFMRCILGHVRLGDVVRETRAQLEPIVAAGIRVSHIDGHKHLHQLPTVRDGVLLVAQELSIDKARTTIGPSLGSAGNGDSGGVARWVRSVLALQSRRLFKANDIRSPDFFIDIAILMADNDVLDRFPELQSNDVVIEVGCHPGTREADIEKPGSCNRFDELSFLMSDEFRDIVSKNSVDLVSYWDL